jgi:hypothetical protein
MAIGAANIALFNLFENNSPWSVIDQPRNLVGFCRGFSVIEIQNEGVGLTAVDAGMVQKVREDPLVVLRTHSTPTAMGLFQVLRAVPRIVFAAVRGHTRETCGAALSELLLLKGKHREEFDKPARPTFLFIQRARWHEGGFLNVDRSRQPGRLRPFAPSSTPVELKCSPATVTARATHIAFLNLSEHPDP